MIVKKKKMYVPPNKQYWSNQIEEIQKGEPLDCWIVNYSEDGTKSKKNKRIKLELAFDHGFFDVYIMDGNYHEFYKPLPILQDEKIKIKFIDGWAHIVK